MKITPWFPSGPRSNTTCYPLDITGDILTVLQLEERSIRGTFPRPRGTGSRPAPQKAKAHRHPTQDGGVGECRGRRLERKSNAACVPRGRVWEKTSATLRPNETVLQQGGPKAGHSVVANETTTDQNSDSGGAVRAIAQYTATTVV